MTRIKALDASYSVFSDASFQQMKGDGYGLFIQGAWTAVAVPGQPRTNLKRARETGLLTAAYISLNGNRSGAGHINKGFDAIGAKEWEYLSFVAIDCEVDNITEKTIRDAETRVLQLGGRPIIYTAYWWWHGRFGNNQNFTHLPLWNAYYDGDPDYDFQRLPYGGWALDDLVGEQYQGSTKLYNGQVDLNMFEADFLQDKPEEDDMGMTAQETAEFQELKETVKEQKQEQDYIQLEFQRLRELLKVAGDKPNDNWKVTVTR